MPSEPAVAASAPVSAAGGLRRIVFLGDPAAKRTEAFRAAARQVGGWDVEVVSYVDLLEGRLRPPPAGTAVRIDSPGGCVRTAKLLLEAGAAPLAALGGTPLSAKEIRDLPCGRGEVLPPRQWYLGLRETLRGLALAWEGAAWTSTPAAVATTFDKRECLRRWAEAGLPTPACDAPTGSYDALRAAAPQGKGRRFVKLRYGYAAVGAVALEWAGERVRALTTVEVDDSGAAPRLFVTKKPQVWRDERRIAWLIDRLAQEEVLVEEWIPKARRKGAPFDLRLTTVRGRVRHVVGRAHPSPFTNLNLGAERIEREELQGLLGEEGFAEAVRVAERAAEQLPEAGSLGVDVVPRAGTRKFVLLEANAFGDYLPGLLWNGRSTYETQLEELVLQRQEAR